MGSTRPPQSVPRILMELLYKSKIGFRDPPFVLDKLESLIRRPPQMRYQIGSDDANRAADALHAMDEDP